MDKIYTVSSLNDRPFIRLTGKWLENNGFNKGDKIRLFYDKEILVLVKIGNNEVLKKEIEIKKWNLKIR